MSGLDRDLKKAALEGDASLEMYLYDTDVDSTDDARGTLDIYDKDDMDLFCAKSSCLVNDPLAEQEKPEKIIGFKRKFDNNNSRARKFDQRAKFVNDFLQKDRMKICDTGYFRDENSDSWKTFLAEKKKKNQDRISAGNHVAWLVKTCKKNGIEFKTSFLDSPLQEAVYLGKKSKFYENIIHRQKGKIQILQAQIFEKNYPKPSFLDKKSEICVDKDAELLDAPKVTKLEMKNWDRKWVVKNDDGKKSCCHCTGQTVSK